MNIIFCGNIRYGQKLKVAVIRCLADGFRLGTGSKGWLLPVAVNIGCGLMVSCGVRPVVSWELALLLCINGGSVRRGNGLVDLEVVSKAEACWVDSVGR